MKKTLLIILSNALFDFSLSQCFGPETFVDFDNTGFWIANETLTNDCNGNGTDMNGELVSAGVYIYALESADMAMTKKMILME